MPATVPTDSAGGGKPLQTVSEQPGSVRQSPDVTVGTVWSETLATLGEPPVLLNRAHFAPGSRTCWHTHKHGQLLHVENGEARVQERGGPILTLLAGQTVVCAPGVEHWHGASPESTMTQLAVTPAGEDGAYAEWGEQVTDSEYGEGHEPEAQFAPVDAS